MAKDHLRRVARLQCNAVHVLNLSEPVADEGVAQSILFPLDPRAGCSVAHCVEKAILAMRPHALAVARRYCQPAREIVGIGTILRVAVFALCAATSMKPAWRSMSRQSRRMISAERSPPNAASARQGAISSDAFPNRAVNSWA